jgi:maleate isomerase
MGADAEDRVVRELERVTGAPVVSTNRAVHAELRRVGARRVATITPYVDELVESIRDGIARAGFDVPVAAGMGIRDPFAICDVPEDDILAFVDHHLRGADCDTLFVSCTNLPAMRLRAVLRERHGLPVVTSNQATIAAALEVLGRRPREAEEVPA